MSSSTTLSPELANMSLVDLDPPPPSPPSLTRSKSISLLPRFTFSQESLVPEPPSRKVSTSSTSTISEVAPSEAPQSPTREVGEDGKVDPPKPRDDTKHEEEEEEAEPTPTIPPTLASPIMSLASTPMRRDGSDSSSDSSTSKGSLSASATPFNFVKKPRQLSIVRNGTPPSFNFDNDAQTATPTSSKEAYNPYTPSQEHTSLPPYPYHSSSPTCGDWNLHLNPYDHTVKIQDQGEITSPRPSKAIRIVSPLDGTKAKRTRISSNPEESSLSHNGEPKSDDSSSPTPPKERKAANLRERRGKAEILSLYSQSQSQSKEVKAALPHSDENDGPSVEIDSNAKMKRTKTPLIFGNYTFSFSFPSSSSSARPSPTTTPSELLVKASRTPLPKTPTTTSSVATMQEAEDDTSPKEEPLPPTPTIVEAILSPGLPARLSPIHDLPGSNPADLSVGDEETWRGSSAPLEGIDEILHEVEEEYHQLALERKEAESVYMGRLEEVMARIKIAAECHVCSDPVRSDQASHDVPERARLEELYRFKLSTLQAQVNRLRGEVHRRDDMIATSNSKIKSLEKSERDSREELEEAYMQYGHFKAEADVTKATLQESLDQQRQLGVDNLRLNQKGSKVLKKYHHAMREKESWERTAAEYKEQLDALVNTTQQVGAGNSDKSKELSFVAVVLEGHARMFGHELIKKGKEGGRELAIRLTVAVQDLCQKEMAEPKIDMIVIQLFVDVATVTKQLTVVNAIGHLGRMRAFLDGFASSSDLSTIHDCVDDDMVLDKMKEHIKLHAHTSSCKMLLIGTSEGQDYVRFLELLKGKGVKDKFYGIQTTQLLEDDPLATLGPGRMVHVDGFFPMEKGDWKILYQRARDEISDAPSLPSTRAPSTVSRASSVMSNYTIRPGSPTHQDQRHNSQYPETSRAPINNTNDHTPLPPWKRPAQPKSNQPATSDFQSVIDRRYNLSPPSTPRGGRSAAPSIVSTATLWKNPTGNHKLVIPIDRDIDIPGGSPPSSDEDEPSVQLPHSAVKHVQRPTTIVQDSSYDSDDASGLPQGFKINAASNISRPTAAPPSRPPVTSKPATRPPWEHDPVSTPRPAPKTYKDIISKHLTRETRSPSVSSFSCSSANSIPLGSGRHSSSTYAGSETESMLSHKTRRNTREYMVSRLR
ncbi:hypothetical protein I302_106935 [Kwoniella bestiolae CBS 10118]|uniref:DUF7923 domain-containing protein n=1 Tax=Kwoniella bestiolae CBS 10118 TaxID=1296100 RepID=A0A1B9FZZ7_9TREE|nr:hypothetical protein I302_05799 [Kwoniella bestiolae CBS 10118]OCF24340.1 hypothetical protein I302_05799 [Kwoniella bestiolae CBS 10118]